MGGICGSSGLPVDERNNRTSERERSRAVVTTTKDAKPKEETEIFEDMPLYEGNHMIGEGIKRIPAYKFELPYDLLEKKRKKFWASKKNNLRIWYNLRECCETDHETATQLLMVGELSCKGSNMQEILDNNTGKIYHLPNWVICDPEIIRDYEYIAKAKEQEEDAELNVMIDKKAYKVRLSNKGKDLKYAYSLVNQVPEDKLVRLFYRGFEIMDDHQLRYHNISNMCNINVFIRPKEID